MELAGSEIYARLKDKKERKEKMHKPLNGSGWEACATAFCQNAKVIINFKIQEA